MKLRADTIFFIIGLFIWLPVIIMGSWFAKNGFSEYKDIFSCVLYEWSGILCPGCGGTRALYHLFSGNLLVSFKYHPAVITVILFYFQFMLLYLCRKYIFIKTRNKEIHIEYYSYALVAVIIIQWLIKIMC